MVFICAEIGVNWRNLNEADEMIREAAAAGADAVKFQAYSMEEAARSPIKHLAKIQLGPMDIRYLYWRCRAAGVEFMCTPFYPEAVAMLNPYVKRWKVRYADRENDAIVRKCAETGKPMLVSHSDPPPVCFTKKYKDSYILYCCPEYPPGLIQSEPIYIKEFDGYSCHVPVVEGMISTVVGAGLEYLEVHVKRDHYPDNYCPIDNAVSITMSELAELCRRLNQ